MSSEEQIEKDKFYMGRALVLAEEAFGKGEVPVGAVIVCRDRIIARDRCYCTCGDASHNNVCQ